MNGNTNKNGNRNGNQNEEKFDVIPGTKPFTKFKFIELGVCLLAVAAGLLYLYAKIIPLYILFPVFVVCFIAIPILRYLDTRARGGKGIGEYLPVIIWAVFAAITAAAMIAYYIKLI